jgi:hypothetical protein
MKEVKITPDTKCNPDCSVFMKCNVNGLIDIYNFSQENPYDFILEKKFTNEVLTFIPSLILNPNNIIVKKNLLLSNTIQNDNYLYNKGGCLVYNYINFNDINFIDTSQSTLALINNNLNVYNNLNFFNGINNITFLENLLINNYKGLSLTTKKNAEVSNNFTSVNTFNVTQNFNTSNLHYNIVNISNNLNIFNNFNITGNLDINTALLNTINTFTTNVDNSVMLYNCNLFLPNSNINTINNGAIQYNNNTNSIDTCLNNKWFSINNKFNSKNTTGIIQHDFIKPIIGTNLDLIQNKNLIFTINNNIINKNIKFYNNNINIYGNLIIKNNLSIHNYLQFNHNTNVHNDLITYNSFFKNKSNLVVKSNIDYSSNLPSIRYNNKYNIFEIFVNYWKPLLHISNNLNTSNILLNKINDTDFNNILFNSNNSIYLNITNNHTSINSNLVNIKQNLNIFGNLSIINNIDTSTLQIGNAILHKKNNVIKCLLNTNNFICQSNFTISNPINIHNHNYTFYSNYITTDFRNCNTINPITNSNISIINYSIFLNKYKIYNDFNITYISIYTNIICNVTFYIKINNIYNYTVNFNNSQYNILTLDSLINSDLFIEIKSNINIDNLFAKIDIKGTYTNIIGQLTRKYSNILIDQPNKFINENRKFIGNVNIKNNLNLYSDNITNINLSNLHIEKHIGIGTSYTPHILQVNDTNPLLIYSNNNNIGIGSINPNVFFNIYSNINSNSINTGSLIIDKNITCNGDITVLNNTHILNNLNIYNTLDYNSHYLTNYNIKDNIICKYDLISNCNINIISNINVNNTLSLPYLIFKQQNSYFSNIRYEHNLKNLQCAFKNENNQHNWKDLLVFPTNKNNSISLKNTSDNLYFTYNQKPILTITDKNIITNDNNINNNTDNILSICSNFNITNNNISVNSKNFKINDLHLFNTVTNIEKHYYSLYNINITNISNTDFSISYNRPRLYENLNTYTFMQSKHIEYIAYQFSLGHTDNNFHPNWNNDSFIFYKNINNINFNSVINETFTFPSNLNNYLNSNIKYDFITNNLPSYNINIDTNKSQLICNNSNPTIFNTSNITLRLYPIYNIRNPTYIYYSNPITFIKP